MTYRRFDAARQAAIIAGAFLTLPNASPVFAASLDGMFAGRDLLLFGSIALLVVGVALRIATHRHRGEPSAPAPDLRWWRNPQP